MTPEVKAQVWAKTSGHCWYCGKLMNPWQDFTVEHMQPKSAGGSDEIGNLVPACETCNGRKYTKNVEGFRQYLLEKKEVKFWGEHALTSIIVSETEEEASRPDFTIAYHIGACLRVGRSQSPGFTITFIALLLASLENYDVNTDGDISGTWFFHLDELAMFTHQNTDAIFGQLMTMHSKNYIDIAWDIGPQGGHSYTFNISFVMSEADRMREEDRKNDVIAYLS